MAIIITKKFFRNKSTFFCFTSEVMLATFLIEVVLAVFIFVRYKMSAFGRLTALIILVLALFQATEYQVCSGINPILWSRIGFALITLLPILGLHLISYVTHKKHFLVLGYTLALSYVLIFIFAPKAIIDTACTGNYIVFQTAQELSWTYYAYYAGFLFLGIWEIAEKLREIKKENIDKDKTHLLWWMLAGYFSFLVPMGIIYIISPEARSGIPSIMCGFALIFAFILVLKVVPLYHKSQ